MFLTLTWSSNHLKILIVFCSKIFYLKNIYNEIPSFFLVTLMVLLQFFIMSCRGSIVLLTTWFHPSPCIHTAGVCLTLRPAAHSSRATLSYSSPWSCHRETSSVWCGSWGRSWCRRMLSLLCIVPPPAPHHSQDESPWQSETSWSSSCCHDSHVCYH